MRRVLFFSLVSVLPIFPAAAQEKMQPVDIKGDQISYLHDQQKVVAEGNVVMGYQDIKLYCEKAVYDSKSHLARVQGDVKIVREGTTIYGEDITYDFASQDAQINNIRVSAPPLYGKARNAEKQGEEKYVLNRGYLTTCDLEEPHYRLSATHVTMYPQEKIVARNMVMKVAEIPIFYFPYYAHSLKDTSFPVEFIPGKDSEWGLYLLGRWRYYLNKRQRGKVLFDFYEERGFGKGISHESAGTPFGDAVFKFYSVEDDLYQLENRTELFDQFPARRSVPDKYLEDDRYKAQVFYSWDPSPELSLRGEFNKFSDKYFMKDFFEEEYEIEPHPLSYGLINYGWNHSSLSLLAQKRANSFFTETEYLPQAEYNFFRQPILDGPFYGESQTSVGYLRSRPVRPADDVHAFRAYSHSVISMPQNIRWLHVDPFVGMYATYYSRNTFGKEDLWRNAPETGLTLSTKLFRTWTGEFSIFGREAEGIRHILTPQLKYHYIHPPTTTAAHLHQFDSIDDLSRKEKITLALDNKIRAKKNDKVWDFVFFSPAVEYDLHPSTGGSRFTRLTADLEVYPREGFSLNSDARYDFVNKAFQEANVAVSWSDAESDKYRVSFGHRYSRDQSSQSTMQMRYQLTPKFQLRNYLRYEYKNGEFEEQQYSLRTDLHCWWMDVGLNVDRERDMTFWVMFRLKAFPDVHVGFEQSYDGAKDEY
ncbi:MAG: LPS assembly protein LptD [Candidatus Omnitrophica bacterium]|nr:LPS assembly protein LptD [Candidatus Omnitrophota bacterium]